MTANSGEGKWQPPQAGSPQVEATFIKIPPTRRISRPIPAIRPRPIAEAERKGFYASPHLLTWLPCRTKYSHDMKITWCTLYPTLLACVLLPVHLGAQSSTNIKRPPIVGVAHIGLNTDNLDAARRFYTDLLGFPEAFSLNKPDGGLLLTNFKVNDHQFIEVFPALNDPQQSRLNHICFETTDADQLRAYLAGKGVAGVPDKSTRTQSRDLAFEVHDPDGNLIEFMQYLPSSMHSMDFGKHLPDGRISQHIIHVGAIVKDQAVADRFYKDILGFRSIWHGGMKEDEVKWVDMRVPDGTDWFEYMLRVENPDVRTRGVMNHMALGVPSVQAGADELLKRGLKTTEKPKIGRDGKWQFNLYDPNLTRVELMEPKPVEKPCCSPILE
jgi:catechol 2,3-dioxygenase-like lactoylglutathione lyase family enzyme